MARSLRTTSVTIAAARHAAMIPSCHTGPQSDIASEPAVQERTYSMMIPLSPTS